MDNDRLAGYWMNMYIIVEEVQQEHLLKDFFRVKSCFGQHKGGVLFLVKNKYGEEEPLVLKCDGDDFCYKKVADTGDDDQDWEKIGFLIETLGPDSLPPYT